MTFPKYIQKMVDQRRIRPAPFDEQDLDNDVYGYTFRLYRENNAFWESTHQSEADRLVAWAVRRGATLSKVLNAVRFTEKEHRKPYYKRDYILIVITDPVALWIEKATKIGKGNSR